MKFHLYRDRKNEWRWRLKARNGRIVAESGEGYDCRRNVVRAVDLVKQEAARAPVTWK